MLGLQESNTMPGLMLFPTCKRMLTEHSRAATCICLHSARHTNLWLPAVPTLLPSRGCFSWGVGLGSCAQGRFLIATSGECVTGMYTVCRVTPTRQNYLALNVNRPRLFLVCTANMLMIWHANGDKWTCNWCIMARDLMVPSFMGRTTEIIQECL